MQTSQPSVLDYENFYNEEIENLFLIATKDNKRIIDITELFSLIQSIGQSNFEIVQNLSVQKEDANLVFAIMENNGQIQIQAFSKVLKTWLRYTGTFKLLEHRNIYISQLIRDEKIQFHKILSAFFLHKKIDMFSVIINAQNNLQDIINIIDYMDFNFSFNEYAQDKKNTQISLTSYHIELFNEIVNGIQNTDLEMLSKALDKLLNMLNIINIFILSQERLAIFPLFQRIFDLIHNSSMIQRLISLLNFNDNSTKFSTIKVLLLD